MTDSGKTGKALIGRIIECGGWDFDPVPYIDKRVKVLSEAFRLAFNGDVTPATLAKMKLIRERMDCLEKQKAELESIMESLSQDFSRQIELLVSAPGIDLISAMTIIPAATKTYLCFAAGSPS